MHNARSFLSVLVVAVALAFVCQSAGVQPGYGQNPLYPGAGQMPPGTPVAPGTGPGYGNHTDPNKQHYATSDDKCLARLLVIEQTLKSLDKKVQQLTPSGEWQVVKMLDDKEGTFTLVNVNTGAVKFVYPKFAKVVEK